MKKIILISIVIFSIISFACSVSAITPTPIATITQTLTPIQITQTEIASQTNIPASTPSNLAEIVKCNYLNLREQPNDNSQIINTFVAGTNVKILSKEIDGKWWLVEVNGQSGYMNSYYLNYK